MNIYALHAVKHWKMRLPATIYLWVQGNGLHWRKNILFLQEKKNSNSIKYTFLSYAIKYFPCDVTDAPFNQIKNSDRNTEDVLSLCWIKMPLVFLDANI